MLYKFLKNISQVFLVEQLRSEFGADNQFTTAVHYVQQKVGAKEFEH